MSAKEIKIIIKAANQKIEDHIIDGYLSWSVGHLKEQISIAYPTKPKSVDQRLIYSGHLLKNEQILADICDTDDTTLTIHMVCNVKATLKNVGTKKTDNLTTTEVNDLNSNSNMSNNNDTRNNLLNLNHELFNNGNSNLNSQMLLNNNDEQMLQQMALFQQMYLQYMTQYLNQAGVNSETIFQVPVVNALNTETNQSIPQVVGNDGGVNGDVDAGNIQNANNEPLARLNAGAGAAAALAGGEDEEDFRNRDWLDWFYWIVRSVIFVFIVYIYSSFSRFILVTGAALLLYLYQQGLINGNERRRNVRRDVNRNNMNEEQLQQAMDGHVDPNTRQSRNADNNNNTTEQISEQNVQSGFKLAWLIVSSLFTSLLPQPPEPVNLN